MCYHGALNGGFYNQGRSTTAMPTVHTQDPRRRGREGWLYKARRSHLAERYRWDAQPATQSVHLFLLIALRHIVGTINSLLQPRPSKLYCSLRFIAWNSNIPVHQVSYESVHNFLRNRTISPFWPYLSMVKNHLKVLVVGSGSSPNSNQFVLVTHRT